MKELIESNFIPSNSHLFVDSAFTFSDLTNLIKLTGKQIFFTGSVKEDNYFPKIWNLLKIGLNNPICFKTIYNNDLIMSLKLDERNNSSCFHKCVSNFWLVSETNENSTSNSQINSNSKIIEKLNKNIENNFKLFLDKNCITIKNILKILSIPIPDTLQNENYYLKNMEFMVNNVYKKLIEIKSTTSCSSFEKKLKLEIDADNYITEKKIPNNSCSKKLLQEICKKLKINILDNNDKNKIIEQIKISYLPEVDDFNNKLKIFEKISKPIKNETLIPPLHEEYRRNFNGVDLWDVNYYKIRYGYAIKNWRTKISTVFLEIIFTNLISIFSEIDFHTENKKKTIKQYQEQIISFLEEFTKQ